MTEEHQSVGASRPDWILVALLGISLSAATALGVDDYRRYEQTRAEARLQYGVQAGDKVPSLEVQSLDRGPIQIDFRLKRADTVLYVTRSTCTWSARNVNNLRTLAAVTPSLVVVSLDSDEAAMRDYARQLAVNAPIYFRPSVQSIVAYGLGATPATIVVSKEGRVRAAWSGAYTGKTLANVEGYFGVKMPGLLSPAEPH